MRVFWWEIMCVFIYCVNYIIYVCAYYTILVFACGWLGWVYFPTQCLTRFNHLNIQISESATLNVFPLFFKRN